MDILQLISVAIIVIGFVLWVTHKKVAEACAWCSHPRHGHELYKDKRGHLSRGFCLRCGDCPQYVPKL